MPFFSVHYKGHKLKRESEKHCSETAGNCFEFVQQFLEIKWKNAFQTPDSWDTNLYDGRVCSSKDITKVLYDRGDLYICPPIGKISFLNNFDLYPARFLGFEVKPNYKIKGKKVIM